MLLSSEQSVPTSVRSSSGSQKTLTRNISALLYGGLKCSTNQDKQWRYFIIVIPPAATVLVGQGFLIRDVSWPHSDTPHSTTLLWTSDQPGAEASTRQDTTFIRHRHPCPPPRNSNPESQQASGRRPTLKTALPLGSALLPTRKKNKFTLKIS